MKIPLFQVDAFTDRAFRGNPAAVCLLDGWIPDHVMQSIAAENNLSETAFLVKKGYGIYELRWFTPATEVDLCGHATLASAYVLFDVVKEVSEEVIFITRSGELRVHVDNGVFYMDFPARPPEPLLKPPGLITSLKIEPTEVLKARDLLVVYDVQDVVKTIEPDFSALTALSRDLNVLGIIVTAPGNGKIDFVSRFFAPIVGVPEDPVTGSAHCTLVPYWARRLGKSELVAYQASKRGGELFCRYCGDRVVIGGKAVLFARGEILLEGGAESDEGRVDL